MSDMGANLSDESLMLPEGCIIKKNQIYCDDRGWLYEGFREKDMPVPLRQMTVAQSVAGSLRGMHVHIKRHDYLMVMSGCLILGLIDFRKDSTTFRQSCVVELTGGDTNLAYIPPGVAHGFGFREDTLYITGMNTYYSKGDEVCLRYDDPGMAIDWGFEPDLMSTSDRESFGLEKAIVEYSRRSADGV